jgi:general secretion pathway protein K
MKPLMGVLMRIPAPVRLRALAQRRARQRGAALLIAMLTLVLVASLSAGAAWQQWRGVEVERAERARIQAGWLLVGALDWARLILREDARSSSTQGVDHLAEPWAVPLQESRLSSFLASDRNTGVLQADLDDSNAFLSGQIEDLQSKLNITSLINAGSVVTTTLASFSKLFDQLNLPPAELATLAENLRFAHDLSPDNRSLARTAMLPQRVEQLTLLGLSAQSLEQLKPFITVLPTRTPVNLNTASAEVLYASIPDLDLDGAQRLVSERSRQHFKTLNDVVQIVPSAAGPLLAGEQYSVATRFFEVTGKLRMVDGADSVVVIERSTVQRDGSTVKTLWRERGSFPFKPSATGGITAEEITSSQR